MSRRRVVQRQLRKLAVGDLREPIVLFRRALRPSMSMTTHEVNHLVDTLITNAWACIMTYNGIDSFDEVNISDAPSHKFYIRYNIEIDVDHDIMIKDNYNNNYKILSTENLENRNEYLLIIAKKLGPDDREVNT